jgi:hypothetical protein
MKTIVLLILVNLSSNAYSFPSYTKKEGKDCVYCHQSSRGGPTNARGRYYAQHKTFAGYLEKMKAKKEKAKRAEEASPSPESGTSPAP